jgi:hypothetical protein
MVDAMANLLMGMWASLNDPLCIGKVWIRNFKLTVVDCVMSELYIQRVWYICRSKIDKAVI